MLDQIPYKAPQQGVPPQQMPGYSPQQAPLSQAPIHPPKTPNITKSGSKLSIKAVGIGCGVLFMFIVGGLSLVFYNLMNNPAQLSSVGLDPNTTKTLLQTFSVLFFGLVTFLGIGLLVVNLYRLITVKNKLKIGYAFGAFFGFFIFIFAIALGARVISMVKNFSVDNILDSDKLIMPYIQLKDGVKYTRTALDLKLIAPAAMFYTLNNNYFNSQILPTLGQVNFTEIFLDCGNGQKLMLNLSTSQFEGSCIYLSKGEYTLNLETNYVNLFTSEKTQKIFPGGSILFDSEITVLPTKSTLLFNDTKTEMIVGKPPIKVVFDASSVFKDLGLSEYKIIWDFNGDGEPDKQNIAATTFVYNEAKLYNIYIRFPNLNNYIYTFPVRVEQSDIPVCEMVIEKGEGKYYTISAKFFDKVVKINSYQFDILDRKKESTIIDTIKNNNGVFSYQFHGAGIYAVQSTFLTEDGKQGQCESEDLQIGLSDFQVNYDVHFKSPQSPAFQKVTNQGIVSLISGELILTEIPSIIKIQVNQISPNTPTATKKLFLDGKQILSTQPNSFEFTISDSTNHEVKLLVEDVPSGAKAEIIIPIKINRDTIVGRLILTPDTVGTEPFTVKFDVSTTIINDPDDELVSFTWDFGDGTGSMKKNFSESIITHTYRYDSVNNNGNYRPVITIKTKKGREVNISPENDIIVKRANQVLDIAIDSHRGQVATIGDRVNFSINFNGLPSEIHRDFGDGKTLNCATRQECAATNHVYTQAGVYTIRSSVTYQDKPTLDGAITLKVDE